VDILKLKEILVEAGIYKKDSAKNYICICPYCGDHKDDRKKGHLYVSTNPEVPIAHCFYSGCAAPITKLIKDLTGSNKLAGEVISLEEQKKAQYKRSKIKKFRHRTNDYKLPEITHESYPAKRLYLKRRTINRLNPEEIPNLILDFSNFLQDNRLDIVGDGDGKILSNQEFDMIAQSFVGFLSRHHTTIYSRSCDESLWMKFKKISLQSDSLHMLDYWSLPGGNPKGDTVVLAEGNFDILGEYVSDSLNIKDKVRLYASGNSFSYSSLLKSVCYDENLYKCNVVILSDIDKTPGWYRKFQKENNHIIKQLDIWANRNGKDFGVFPIRPFKYKDTKF